MSATQFIPGRNDESGLRYLRVEPEIDGLQYYVGAIVKTDKFGYEFHGVLGCKSETLREIADKLDQIELSGSEHLD